MTDKIPLCIISFNRGLYLNSLLHSLDAEREDFDIIVVDNGSKEKKTQDVLEAWSEKISILRLAGNDWINDEYKAKNAFLKECKIRNYRSSSCIFLQDDMQYIGPKNMLKYVVEDLERTSFLNVSMTGVRMSTIQTTYSGKRNKNVWEYKDNHFMTIGWYKMSVFEKVGEYSQNYPIKKEFWGRGEDDYHARVVKEYGNDFTISGNMHVPIFVGVWNDPRGHYSFLRDNKRYGHYLPPTEGNLYYKHLSKEAYEGLFNRLEPSGYIDIAFPAGWDYAKTQDGDQMKYPQQKIIVEGPVCNIE